MLAPCYVLAMSVILVLAFVMAVLMLVLFVVCMLFFAFVLVDAGRGGCGRFLEMVMQPFPGSDGIVQDSSNQETV